MKRSRSEINDVLLIDAGGESSACVQPNLAPMLDTVFLIIAVLLVAMIQMTAVKGLPTWTVGKNERAAERGQTQRVEVVLPRNGLPRVDGTPTAIENLASALDRAEARRAVDVVYLLAHTDVSYGRVVDALMRLQRPGHPPVHLGVAVETTSVED